MAVISPALWGGTHFRALPGEAVVPNQYLVKALPGVSPQEMAAAALTPVLPDGKWRQLTRDISIVEISDAAMVETIARHPLVQYIEPNRIRKMSSESDNDPGFSLQWALQTMQALQAWQLVPGRFLTSSTPEAGRLKVAILDTGVDCTHPDFMNAGGTSTDSAQGGQLSFALSRAIVATTVPSATCPWEDDNGHGTATAGILAAAAQNAVGVAGLAYPVELIVYKVLSANGSGDDGSMATAIQNATDAGARIISMSIAGVGYSQSLQAAINYAWQHDALVVAATGNAATSTPFFPAASNFAVGVGASDQNNNIAGFSDYGYDVAIAAPGVGIYSLTQTYNLGTGLQNYAFWTGTSAATPYVAATAGLIATGSPNIPAAVMLQRLQQSAMQSSTGTSGGWDQYAGYGIVNAYNAVAGTLTASTYGSLTGQVIDVNALPIQYAQVTINGTVVSGDNAGRFRVPNLPPGTYTVTASAAAHPAQTLTTTIVAGADTVLPIVLGGNYGQFSGTITDGSSNPVSGAVVQALSAGLIQATAFTNTKGQYSLWVPQPGAYAIRTAAIGRESSTVPSQTVAGAGNTQVNLTLPLLGSVAGVVQDGSQNPVAGAQLVLSSGNFSVGAVSNANGSYSTLGVPAGTYSLTVTATGQPNTTVTNVVVGTGVSTVNVQMGSGANPLAVSITPASITIQSGQTAQFSAIVSGSPNSAVTWSVSPQVGSISATGMYQSPATVSGSTVVQVIATSVATPIKSASASITILPAPITVSINPATVNLTAAQSQQFAASVAGTSNTAVTWSMSPQMGQLSAAGMYTAPATVASMQPVKITATSMANTSMSASATVMLQATSGPVTISLSPGSVNLAPSQSQQFTASVAGSSNTAVTWSLSPQIGQLNSTGLYVAPSSITAAQTVTITATTAATPSKSASATITLLPPQTSGVCPAPTVGAFTGCYYNNTSMTGDPAMVRTDSQINFNWGTTAPAATVTPRNFSVNWQGMFSFNQGTYVFSLYVSDGMQFYIDGVPVRSAWRNEAPSLYTISQTLSQGNHLISLNYYEQTGTATAVLSWASSTPAPGPTAAPVITSFTASPSGLAAGQSATLSWIVSGATSLSVNNGVGNVSTLTSTVVSPPQTTIYTLTASNSAGTTTAQAVVEVNAVSDTQPPTTPVLVSAMAKSSTEVDLAWSASTDNVGVAGYQILRNGIILGSVTGATLAYVDTAVSANMSYTYAVRAFDAASNYSGLSNSIVVATAPAPALSTCPAPVVGAFTACYYNNTSLAGNPVLVRTDNQIDFNWGSGSPASSVTPLNFSARWQGIFNFNQGNYIFTAFVSDGMQFYIDGVPVRSAWRSEGPSLFLIPQALSQGSHLITLEYYEQTGNATAVLSWQQD